MLAVHGLHHLSSDYVWQFIRNIFNEFADLADCKAFAFYFKRRLVGQCRTPFRRPKFVDRRPKRFTLVHAALFAALHGVEIGSRRGAGCVIDTGSDAGKVFLRGVVERLFLIGPPRMLNANTIAPL